MADPSRTDTGADTGADWPGGLSLDITDTPDGDAEAVLDAGLTAHALGEGAPFERIRLGLYLKDAAGRTVGGLVGNLYPPHGAAIVKDFWLPDDLRGSGIGRRLMEALEREVLSRGATLIHLDTFDFQARGFYERLGYEVVGEVRYPKSGRMRYFLARTLADARAED